MHKARKNQRQTSISPKRCGIENQAQMLRTTISHKTRQSKQFLGIPVKTRRRTDVGRLHRRQQVHRSDLVSGGIENGNMFWCVDGSYHRSKAPSISRARWMCCSTEPSQSKDKTPRVGMKGRFWGKKSNSTGSYRAEQLWVCAIHHLTPALTSFYKIEN